jgi:hypothetical protein
MASFQQQRVLSAGSLAAALPCSKSIPFGGLARTGAASQQHGNSSRLFLSPIAAHLCLDDARSDLVAKQLDERLPHFVLDHLVAEAVS